MLQEDLCHVLYVAEIILQNLELMRKFSSAMYDKFQAMINEAAVLVFLRAS
jgi:hypothetical protein